MKYSAVLPNICGSSVCNLLGATLLATRILRWLLIFLENLWIPADRNPRFSLILSHMTTVSTLILNLCSVSFNIISRQYINLPDGFASLCFLDKYVCISITTRGLQMYWLFKLINQPDAAISQVYYLSFKYSSTCFGHPHAHHQELNNFSSSLWFTFGMWC